MTGPRAAACPARDRRPADNVAGQLAADAGLQERIAILGGDLSQDTFGEGYDVIWCSSVLHFVPDCLDLLRRASAIVVVAGMDGALPSVVAGLVSAPVVAVPTSVGYGAAFEGLAALLAMLNACAPGVAVVNIDNGYGAGHLAAQIAAPQQA